jgi:molybdopterin molybdotransferase
VLAAGLTAPVDLPPFAASAMDGYALRSSDLRDAPPFRLQVVGASTAGHPWTGPVPAGACIRVFTGAVVPEALDAVVIQENCSVEGGSVVIHTNVAPGDNLRPRGHDVARGDGLLDGGTRLAAHHIAWLAACGFRSVHVYRRPRVAVLSTGDELAEPGRALAPGQIFDANRLALLALLGSLPLEIVDYGIVPDTADAIRRVLDRAGASCDAVITSGGVSVGDTDLVKETVRCTGTLDIWKLNIKPGKPLAVGRTGRAMFFGLPGNPVSTIVTALLVARPALLALAGASPDPAPAFEATLEGTLRHPPGREEFQRGRFGLRNGRLRVRVTGDQSSNRLASFARANCLIRVPAASGDLEDGDVVSILPLEGLL